MSLLKYARYNLGLFYNVLNKLTACKRFYNDVIFEDIPEVSSTLIKRILKTNNITYEEGYTCFIVQCTLCKKHAKANSSKLYINKTTGMYMCSHCKCNGQWNEFELSLVSRKAKKAKNNDEEEVKLTELDNLIECLNVTKNESLELKSLPEDSFKTILKEFKLPDIASTSVENIDIRINETYNTIYFPLENVESDIVGYRTVKSCSNEEKVLPSITYGGILCGKMPKNKDTAILVPTISDFLILLNSKVTGNILCLPNGVNNLSQYVLPTLERFKKLILWLGNDMKSWDSARHFAKKLGEKRCLLIRPSDKHELPHLKVDQDFKSIISSAQPIWHKSITTFASLRAEVLSDLQNIDKVQGVKWKRYPTLNKILKGHRRGELTVITGPTGSGKTTFISEYSLDLAMQGVNTLWGSFEIRNARLARTMLQQMAGVPLDENLQMFDKWADDFEKLPVYFMTFHGQQSIKVVMEAVEHAAYIHDIAHVIIDNVQFMLGMSEEPKVDRFWKQDAIIAAFRSFSTRKNCHVTLVIHPRKERDDEDLTTSSIFGGVKASQEADNVLIIQDKRLTSVRGKKYLQVAKNRYSGDLGVMPLEFDKRGLSYSQKKPKISDEEKRNEENTNSSEIT